MDRGARQVTVNEVQRVRHDLATKQQETSHYLSMFNKLPQNLVA